VHINYIPPYSTHLYRKHRVHIDYIKQYTQFFKEIQFYWVLIFNKLLYNYCGKFETCFVTVIG
jgi:hypothetical protein